MSNIDSLFFIVKEKLSKGIKGKKGQKREKRWEEIDKKNIKPIDWDVNYLSCKRLSKSMQSGHGVRMQNLSTFYSVSIFYFLSCSYLLPFEW